MDAFLQALRNIGPGRLTLMGGVIIMLVAFFVWIAARLASPQYELLYGDLGMQDSGKIITQLEADGIPYELAAGGATVLVPGDHVPEARMKLANAGLPSGGSIGYEIFDSADSLGATNFMQNVNLVRALEGELGRTISTIEAVDSARVHLVMPRRELFSRERQEPSASVILRMRGSSRLSTGQVLAVQHLVASAVPGLSPGKISIVDGRGTLLAGGAEDEGSTAVMAAKADERKRAFENRLARTIETLLEKTVGIGSVRANVTADMDFDRINTSEEVFDPDGQVVRSTQNIEETATSRESLGPPPVTVQTNLPDADLAASEGGGATTAESRTEETVNFEITKRVVNHVRDIGIVNRLSVAVLVDGIYGPGADGPRTYSPRPQENIDQLAILVRGAIGYDAQRGDTIEVINMQFADPPEPEEEKLQLFFGLDKNDLLRTAEILVLAIVAILVILLVVRPLVARAFEAIPTAIGPDGQIIAAEPGAPALAAPGAPGVPGMPVPGERPGEEDFDEMIDLDRVEGRVKASSVCKVGEIVDKHPEEALSIIRSWLYAEG